MSSYDTWHNLLSGISQGSFDKICIKDANGVMTDLLTLIGAAAGAAVNSATAPLSINNGVLSINLTGYIPTSHESYNVGQANVNFGAYDARTQTLTLENASGVTCQLNVDLGGNLNVGTAGVVTVPILNAWAPTALKLTDTAGTVHNLSSATTGELLWDGLEVQLRQNAFHQINVVAPLTASGANVLTLDTLWKPSTVTTLTGLTAVANDALGQLVLGLDGSESRSELKLIDSQGVVRSLIPSITGALTYAGSTLVDLTYLANNYSTTSSINTSFAAKQDVLTASTGIKLNGATISSYGLRWNVNSVPTLSIDEVHFNGYNVTETLNLSTGKVEFKVEAPLDMATMTWANSQTWNVSQVQGLQARLDTIAELETSIGVSLGINSGANGYQECRFALYEDNLVQHNHWYGMALYVGATVGMGLWGSSGVQTIDQGNGVGAIPHLFLQNGSFVGINTVTPVYQLDVTGDIRATGSIIGASKAFLIDHPDPSKDGQKLRHWCVEGDDPGGAVMYRRQLDCARGTNVLQMPSWFRHLAQDVLCFTSPVHHFGLSWAAQDAEDPNIITVGVSKDGLYNILVTGCRKDKCATTMCPQEVEFTPEPIMFPKAGPQGFPSAI